MELAKGKCEPCKGGIPPLKGKGLKISVDKLGDKSWKVIDEHHIEKEFKFPDFKTALEFVNKVGKISEKQGHHPEIVLNWGSVVVRFWTHKINGLHENDFIMAAKVNEIY